MVTRIVAALKQIKILVAWLGLPPDLEESLSSISKSLLAAAYGAGVADKCGY